MPLALLLLDDGSPDNGGKSIRSLAPMLTTNCFLMIPTGGRRVVGAICGT